MHDWVKASIWVALMLSVLLVVNRAFDFLRAIKDLAESNKEIATQLKRLADTQEEAHQ